jgi:hypothetical protein
MTWRSLNTELYVTRNLSGENGEISPGAQRQTANSVQDGYGEASDHVTWHRLELQWRDGRNHWH